MKTAEKKKTKKQINPQTIYQTLSSQRNYTRFFMLKDVTLGHCPDIKISYNTDRILETINKNMEYLRESFDDDWLRTKNKWKETLAPEDDIPF